MTDQTLRETVIRLAQPVVHSLGLLVWGVEIARAGRTLVRRCLREGHCVHERRCLRGRTWLWKSRCLRGRRAQARRTVWQRHQAGIGGPP